jgi:predicted O-methyltransferase YrrM
MSVEKTAADQARKAAKREKKCDEALRYEYYWYKAYKRLDIRQFEGFGPLADKTIVAHRTGMKQDRLYTLWQAVQQLPPGNHAIAEVGAYQGGSARFIGEAMRWHNRENPFFVCDTFRGHAVVDETLDGEHRVGEQFVNTSAADVTEYLKDLTNIRVVAGDFRETSAQLEAHAPFAFVHLDVDVYPVTRYGLEFFAPRMLPGGLIVADDYGFTTCQGARKGVDEFARAHPEYRFFHLLTGQALLTRVI